MKEKEDLTLTPAAVSALAEGDTKNFIVASTPGGIEAQEAAGQKALVNSELLPLAFNFCTKADFEKVGFTFGEAADDLFQKATLPAGWKKVATDHSMWSKIVDEKGRERVNIFYKAAFYDRNAFMSINRRYSVRPDYTEDGDRTTRITDWDGTVLYSVKATSEPDEQVWQRNDRSDKAALAWIQEHYPNYMDPTAYWED